MACLQQVWQGHEGRGWQGSGMDTSPLQHGIWATEAAIWSQFQQLGLLWFEGQRRTILSRGHFWLVPCRDVSRHNRTEKK